MRANNYSTVSFLSDYGNKDEFVGVVKSVIRSIANAVSIIDITHGIKPHDIRAGSLALARASQYLLRLEPVNCIKGTKVLLPKITI